MQQCLQIAAEAGIQTLAGDQNQIFLRIKLSMLLLLTFIFISIFLFISFFNFQFIRDFVVQLFAYLIVVALSGPIVLSWDQDLFSIIRFKILNVTLAVGSWFCWFPAKLQRLSVQFGNQKRDCSYSNQIQMLFIKKNQIQMPHSFALPFLVLFLLLLLLLFIFSFAAILIFIMNFFSWYIQLKNL